MKRWSLLVFIAIMGWGLRSQACTNLIVGKNASVDGSVLISYSSDDFGMFGSLWQFRAGTHPKGTLREIRNWEDNAYLGKIAEASVTYNVIGNINEHQVAIAETTFGGREELVDTAGIMDYGSMIYVALQRSKTAREAIRVMTDLVKEYGYASEGETFTIADPNEVWIMEMIGKGPGRKGAVWVALRVPDDCICAHANQSRIHRFDRKDKKNCMYSPDVISFAREKGYFSGKDDEFDFANAYCPPTFSGLRFCEARVWSFFNKWVDGMDQYLDYASGKKEAFNNPMPLFFKPKQKLSVRDIQNGMRDHYEGTPFDVTQDVGSGPFAAPYRPTPLTWECDGKKYFNERPISTQQAAFVFVAQVRASMPNAVGGILWFANDEANTTPFTPVYCCTKNVPVCYAQKTADGVTFSWESAFWVCNWVANMVYPRYSMLFGDLKSVRDELENQYASNQAEIEAKAMELLKTDKEAGEAFLDQYTNQMAAEMMVRWKKLGEHLIVKYNDGVIRPERNGRFERTPHGQGVRPVRVGYPDAYRRVIVKETGERYLLPVE